MLSARWALLGSPAWGCRLWRAEGVLGSFRGWEVPAAAQRADVVLRCTSGIGVVKGLGGTDYVLLACRRGSGEWECGKGSPNPRSVLCAVELVHILGLRGPAQPVPMSH